MSEEILGCIRTLLAPEWLFRSVQNRIAPAIGAATARRIHLLELKALSAIAPIKGIIKDVMKTIKLMEKLK